MIMSCHPRGSGTHIVNHCKDSFEFDKVKGQDESVLYMS
jgi:hypothetical protein